MSGYASIAELKERLAGFYVELYRIDDTGLAADNLAGKDLADAQAEVDASVGVRYVTPVSAPAALPLLKNWCLTLAEELAWSRGGRDSVPENVKDRVSNARKLLLRLAGGSLALEGAAERGSSAGGASEIIIATPVFSRDQLKGW